MPYLKSVWLILALHLISFNPEMINWTLIGVSQRVFDCCGKPYAFIQAYKSFYQHIPFIDWRCPQPFIVYVPYSSTVYYFA